MHSFNITCILELIFTCVETFRLGRARWLLLSRLVFGVCSAGLDVGDRPEITFSESILKLHFSTQAQFNQFCRRAFSHDASRLVDFEILSMEPHQVKCGLILNLTPKLRVVPPGHPEPDIENSDVVIYY